LIQYSHVVKAHKWDQDKFERLLAEWLVTSDQPFSEVNNPAFHDLLQYTYNCGKKLSVPNRQSVKCKIMKMGQNSVEETRKFFKVHFIHLHTKANH